MPCQGRGTTQFIGAKQQSAWHQEGARHCFRLQVPLDDGEDVGKVDAQFL